MIQTREEIVLALDEQFNKFHNWISAQEEAKFTFAPEGKWTTGQHLDHLIRSVKPLNMALGLPKFGLRATFGKPDRSVLTYQDIVDKYKNALLSGGAASGRFIPKSISVDQKSRLLQTYLKEKDILIDRSKKWKEEDLDAYLLPHPLIGKILVREMLFFTVHHTEHHLISLKKNYYDSTN